MVGMIFFSQTDLLEWLKIWLKNKRIF